MAECSWQWVVFCPVLVRVACFAGRFFPIYVDSALKKRISTLETNSLFLYTIFRLLFFFACFCGSFHQQSPEISPQYIRARHFIVQNITKRLFLRLNTWLFLSSFDRSFKLCEATITVACFVVAIYSTFSCSWCSICGTRNLFLCGCPKSFHGKHYLFVCIHFHRANSTYGNWKKKNIVSVDAAAAIENLLFCSCLLTRDVEKNNYVDIFSHFLRSSAITLSSQFLLVLDDSAEN